MKDFKYNMIYVELATPIKGIGYQGKFGYISSYNSGDEKKIGTNCHENVGVVFEGNRNSYQVPLSALIRKHTLEELAVEMIKKLRQKGKTYNQIVKIIESI